MKKFSRQIQHFYTTFTKIKRSAWHGDTTIILKKALSLSKVMTWCILGAVWVVNFWNSAGSWNLPGKAADFPVVRDVAALGEHQGALPRQQQSKRQHCREHQGSSVAAPNAFCSVSCVTWAGKAKGWRAGQEAHGDSAHPADVILSSSNQGSLDGNWNCIFHTAFQGFPRGSQ